MQITHECSHRSQTWHHTSSTGCPQLQGASQQTLSEGSNPSTVVWELRKFNKVVVSHVTEYLMVTWHQSLVTPELLHRYWQHCSSVQCLEWAGQCWPCSTGHYHQVPGSQVGGSTQHIVNDAAPGVTGGDDTDDNDNTCADHSSHLLSFSVCQCPALATVSHSAEQRHQWPGDDTRMCPDVQVSAGWGRSMVSSVRMCPSPADHSTLLLSHSQPDQVWKIFEQKYLLNPIPGCRIPAPTSPRKLLYEEIVSCSEGRCQESVRPNKTPFLLLVLYQWLEQCHATAMIPNPLCNHGCRHSHPGCLLLHTTHSKKPGT